MTCIEPLLAKVTKNAAPRLLCNGVVCWLIHAQPLPVSFLQSLSDIGGWALAEESTQTLWFFPSPDVMLGLARLHNWARLHPMSTAITVFDGSLVVDEQLTQSLKVKSELQALCTEFPKRLIVRVSARLREVGRTLTGLSFRHVQNPDGLAGDWFELESSEQVSVAYRLNWLWIIRPQGNRQDRIFVKGWRSYFERLEAILSQNKISYLHAEDQNLVLRVTTPRVMARLTTEILTLIEDKEVPPWPCKYMAVEMGDQSFSPDLAGKLRYVVEALEPNTLYLPLATIFQIADSRIVPVDSRTSMDNSTLTDLFQVRFHSSKGGKRRGSLNVFLPSSLISGAESPCFYCGLRSHSAQKCPSRILQPGNVHVTDLSRFARIDLDTLPGILTELEKLLAPDILRGLTSLLGEKTNLALVVRSVFEVNMICQLRMMATVWRAKGIRARQLEVILARDRPRLALGYPYRVLLGAQKGCRSATIVCRRHAPRPRLGWDPDHDVVCDPGQACQHRALGELLFGKAGRRRRVSRALFYDHATLAAGPVSAAGGRYLDIRHHGCAQEIFS